MNVSLKTLQNAFFNEIKKIKEHPVPTKELQRIRNTLIADTIYEKDSIADQANPP